MRSSQETLRSPTPLTEGLVTSAQKIGPSPAVNNGSWSPLSRQCREKQRTLRESAKSQVPLYFPERGKSMTRTLGDAYNQLCQMEHRRGPQSWWSFLLLQPSYESEEVGPDLPTSHQFLLVHVALSVKGGNSHFQWGSFAACLFPGFTDCPLQPCCLHCLKKTSSLENHLISSSFFIAPRSLKNEGVRPACKTSSRPNIPSP